MSRAYFVNNFECWLNSYNNFFEELGTYKIYSSVLENARIQGGLVRTMGYMFGNFKCYNCRWSWSSTQCSTEIIYGYNLHEQQAELEIAYEFGQACRRCNSYVSPVFDQEATDKAMSKAVERIQKVMYNMKEPGNESSERHSRARDRREAHDFYRCEACWLGICNFDPYRIPRHDPETCGACFEGVCTLKKTEGWKRCGRKKKSGKGKRRIRYEGTLASISWAFYYRGQFAGNISAPNGETSKETTSNKQKRKRKNKKRANKSQEQGKTHAQAN